MFNATNYLARLVGEIALIFFHDSETRLYN